jgi:Holliday junction resolvase RusA-like endonuclease
VKFTVPLKPLGLNNAYRNVPGVGRVKTAEAESYRQAVAAHAIQARSGMPTLAGPVAVWLRLFLGNDLQDIDGGVKLLLDGMQLGRVYPNDSRVHLLIVQKNLDVLRPHSEVEVLPLEEARWLR